jgi:hypothetical protein
MAQSAAGTYNEALMYLDDIIKANEPKTKSKKIKTSSSRKKTTNTDIKYYAQHIAKGCNSLKNYSLKEPIPEPQISKLDAPPTSTELYSCVIGFKKGETTSGYFYKSIPCGREYCEHCSKDYSIPHNRRIVRVFPKVMQMKKAGYWVITIPKNLRKHFYDKKQLNAFRDFIRRKLKRGYNLKIQAGTKFYKKNALHKVEKAFLRWHFCGEDGATFHPHLNIISETGYLPEYFLQDFKHDLMRYFKNTFKLDYEPKPNLYYAYLNETESDSNKNKLKHWIKYITRATAKKTFDADLITTITKFRNITYLGVFEKSTEKSESNIHSIINKSIDSETGEKIVWHKELIPKAALKEKLSTLTDLGAGIYFELKPPPPPLIKDIPKFKHVNFDFYET